ncbi:MAG: aminotransferase class V-fold PLP-dependent enzyme [Gemmatimonadaceae bacterium]
MERRAFLASGISAAALPALRGSSIARLLRAEPIAAARAPAAVAADEEYWGEIQRAFDVDRTLINLNNGGCSPAPTHVLDQMIRDLKFSNEIPVIHMWSVLEPRIETVRADLAREFGCDPEEMAIVRNASEANETMILGLDLKAGDEVLVTNQNYGRMLDTWAQRARRYGIVVKTISFKVPPPSSEYIVDRFREAITPRTRVIEVTHITNLTGQIMPIRDIVRMARPKGIEVFVDGAHAFAHFPFKRDDLECDYFGTSLHKNLLCPIGTGFLYVRHDKIKTLWPMMGVASSLDGNIRKYEEIGTHPAANHNSIAAALAFHRGIGAERKAARLRFLRNRWAKRLLAHDPARVHVLTPLDDDKQACSIALVNVDGLDTAKLQGHLFAKHRIVTTPIIHAEFNGLRITPNVYTTLDEVDFFADKMIDAMKSGIA